MTKYARIDEISMSLFIHVVAVVNVDRSVTLE